MKPILPSNNLEKVLGQFNEDQLRTIMRNTFAIQLTEGCSIGCNFCGFEAKKGINDYIPFEFLEKLVGRFGSELTEGIKTLYYASDPFDYDFDVHDILDARKLFTDLGSDSFLSTAVPKGKEDHIISLLKGDDKGWNKSKIGRISVSEMNKKRLEKAFKRHFPQLESPQIKIRYCVKNSDEKSRGWSYEHTWKEFMNFKEIRRSLGLNPHELNRISPQPIYAKTEKYWLGDKPKEGELYGIELPGKRFILSPDEPVNFKDIIASYQGELNDYANYIGFINPIYGEAIGPYKLGQKNKDNLSKKGIDCYHGVIITPSGVFNLQKVVPSPEYPLGHIKTPINPDKFEVVVLQCLPMRLDLDSDPKVLAKFYETTTGQKMVKSS